MEKDHFGLGREIAISKSGVRQVFTPHTPINSTDLFWGRETEVQNIIEQINTPGQHSLLYGERGVGKSSLANIAANLLLSKIISGKLYPVRCDSSSTFETILAAPLKDVGVDVTLAEMQRRHVEGGNANVGVPGFAGGAIESRRESQESYVSHQLSPSFVGEKLRAFPGLLVVDEADVIKIGDKKKIAELIKNLSDSSSPFKVLIVGVAKIGEELIGGHQSVGRCLKETPLPRMRDSELSKIVTEGATKLSLEFDAYAVDAIVKISAGYPHFTHLLALKCAEDAVVNGYTQIASEHLKTAMLEAAKDAEGSLKRTYEAHTRSYATDKYKVILNAAAVLPLEFKAEELRAKVESEIGKPFPQEALNNYLKRLITEHHDSILTRPTKGIYRFTDPRMASYIKIVNQLV